jgi:HEAT repeat protein
MRRLLLMTCFGLIAGCAGPSTEDWVRQLKDEDVVKRRQAVRELQTRAADADRIVPALTEALRDENAYVRHDAAIALGLFGAEAQGSVHALRTALKDKEANVRQAAAQALQRIDPATARKVVPKKYRR